MSKVPCACQSSGRPGYVKRRKEAYGVNTVGYEWVLHSVCGGSGWIHVIDDYSVTEKHTQVRNDYFKHY